MKGFRNSRYCLDVEEGHDDLKEYFFVFKTGGLASLHLSQPLNSCIIWPFWKILHLWAFSFCPSVLCLFASEYYSLSRVICLRFFTRVWSAWLLSHSAFLVSCTLLWTDTVLLSWSWPLLSCKLESYGLLMVPSAWGHTPYLLLFVKFPVSCGLARFSGRSPAGLEFILSPI